MERLKTPLKTVGVKQSRRAIRDGRAAHAFIALDVEPGLQSSLRELCAEFRVPMSEVETMSELGKACGIEIGASIAVLIH